MRTTVYWRRRAYAACQERKIGGACFHGEKGSKFDGVAKSSQACLPVVQPAALRGTSIAENGSAAFLLSFVGRRMLLVKSTAVAQRDRYVVLRGRELIDITFLVQANGEFVW